MAERPWMPIYWGDYFRDTMALSAEESGAYLHLIGAYWIAGRPLPDDAPQLCRISKVAPQRWSRVWLAISRFFERVSVSEAQKSNSVMAGYDDVRNRGYGEFCLIHKRIEKELLKVSVRSASASASAKQRARASTTTVIEEESPPSLPSSTTSQTVVPAPQGADPTNGAGQSKRGSDRGTRLSEDWTPGDDGIAYAKDFGFSSEQINAMFEDFRDTFLAKAGAMARKVSWPRTWKRWVRTEYERVREKEARQRRWAEQRGRPAH